MLLFGVTHQLPIDEIVHHGRVFNLRRAMPVDDLRAAVGKLFAELIEREIPFALVGGVALLTFVEGRNTEDVDLIVEAAAVEEMPWGATLRDDDFGHAEYSGVHVDLLLTSNALFRHVMANERTTVRFQEHDVPIATREGLLLLKLYALPSLYRQGKLARAALYETDILMLHQGVDVDDEGLLGVLSAHLSATDITELRKILEEQRTRTRF